MASVIGLPVRGSRNFSANQTIKQKLNSGPNYWWYLLGGSVCAGAYFKWKQTYTVTAFNPKKMKVYCGKAGTRYSRHQPVPTKTTRSGSTCPDIM